MKVVDLVHREEKRRWAAIKLFASRVSVGRCLELDSAVVSTHEAPANGHCS